MIELLYEKIDDTRTLLYHFGYKYTGVYLAIILFLASVVVFSRNEKENRGFIDYTLSILVLLFCPGLATGVSKLMCDGMESVDIFMVFPTVLVSVFGMIIVGSYIEKNHNKDSASRDYSNVFWKRIIVAAFLLVLVEASVPLQVTINNFTVPRVSGKYDSNVIEISNLIMNEPVILPNELCAELITYNWNTNVFLSYDSDVDEQLMEAFRVAHNSEIPFVVVKIHNTLGTEDAGEAEAQTWGYTQKQKMGQYCVYYKEGI